MNDKRKNLQLEDYLDGDSELSRLYRTLEQPEPPADLDRKVIAQARNSLASTRQHKGRLPRGWVLTASTIGVLALSLTVVLQISSPPNVDPAAETPEPASVATPAAEGPRTGGTGRVAPGAFGVPAKPSEPAGPALDYPGPDEWLAAIETLREAGQHEEAAEELKRFKLAYPGYVIGEPPPDGGSRVTEQPKF